MKQLKLNLNPRKEVTGPKAIFVEIRVGGIGIATFFKWLKAREKAAYYKGHSKGYKEGYSDGKPKERYQGEFGARSNY
jgi:hypothetical protein